MGGSKLEYIGRKIYYDKVTGNVLVDTGEKVGFVRQTTQEEDFEAYTALGERAPNTIGVLELEYEQYKNDFMQCNGYRVNQETLALEFSYPDPENPESPTQYQSPLTEQIANLKAENDDLKVRTQDLELMMGDIIASGLLG